MAWLRFTKSMFHQFHDRSSFSHFSICRKKIMGNQSKQAITCNNLKSFSNDRPGMIVVKIICLHFRIDGHHLFRSIPLASRKLHRSQSVDEPVSQISHGNFTNFLAIKVKFCLKIISSNLFLTD